MNSLDFLLPWGKIFKKVISCRASPGHNLPASQQLLCPPGRSSRQNLSVGYQCSEYFSVYRILFNSNLFLHYIYFLPVLLLRTYLAATDRGIPAVSSTPPRRTSRSTGATGPSSRPSSTASREVQSSRSLLTRIFSYHLLFVQDLYNDDQRWKYAVDLAGSELMVLSNAELGKWVPRAEIMIIFF